VLDLVFVLISMVTCLMIDFIDNWVNNNLGSK
jgi:hypothetical protein